MSKGKGRGWHGDSERHRLASLGIPTAAGARAWEKEWAVHERKERAKEQSQKILDALYASEESEFRDVEMYVEKAIEQMEEIVLGPKMDHRARWPSEKEYKDAFSIFTDTTKIGDSSVALIAARTFSARRMSAADAGSNARIRATCGNSLVETPWAASACLRRSPCQPLPFPIRPPPLHSSVFLCEEQTNRSLKPTPHL